MNPLTDPWFEAKFVTDFKENGSHRSHHDDDSPLSFSESQGVQFYCPCRFGQTEGAHCVLVLFANPPCDVASPANSGPASRDGKSHPRWTVSGSGLHDLTLAPSVDVGDPSWWHGFVQAGIVK